MRKLAIALLLAAALVPLSAVAGTLETYELAWSGASFGNGATATGLITLDLSLLPNPEASEVDIYSDITALSVTVTGASSGNGTWTRSDLTPTSSLGTYTYWSTNGATLDMSTELVGQADPWGTPDGLSGDFNLFFGSGGPLGTFYFTLTTDDGRGDSMLLTSFAPAVPEPGTVLLFGTGLAGLATILRRKRRA